MKTEKRSGKRSTKWRKNDWELLSMVMLGVVFVAVFSYGAMFGVVLAFKNGNNQLNVLEAMRSGAWVGLENFRLFLHDSSFWDVLANTLGLNVLMLFINFPAPILLAILLNEVRYTRYKKIVQTISYMPHFLSWVIFGGIVTALISVDGGLINDILLKLDLISAPLDIKGEPQYFWALIIITSLIKGVGWGSVIYMAAISGIDACLYEAAQIDGAGRLKRIIHITLPGIAPTVVTYLLLSVSGLLNNSVEHILVFQTNTNLQRSQVIDTFVLRYGITQRMWSYATAVGLFKSVVAVVLIGLSNHISKKVTGKGVY